MKQKSVGVVGAAETTKMGKIPDVSVIGLHADAALNALADAGLKPSDIDGVACAGISPVELAHYMGITPTYADGTSVGGCSFMLHVRHAAAAINEGLCTTVLITHGESGRSRVGSSGFGRAPSSLMGQFEMPYGVAGPPTMFTIPVLRYLKTYGLTAEDLAWVAVIQREWAAKNPRASFKDPLTVDDVLGADMIAWPFTKLMCCLVTDGGGALILTSAERAKDFPQKPVYVLGTGESVETPLVSQMADFTSSKAFRVSGKKAFDESGLAHADVDHLMIYDAFAHLPLYGLEDLGFCKPGEAAGFIRERNTAIGGKLPLNTNGGGLSYMHSGMYGMYALQESVRQLRGIAPAQVPGARTSVCHGVGGMFAASGTVIFSNEAP
ncbi:thiolase domain-containing protein [Phenylobacterium sp.]|uniref:thiolase C-terminal domain-containing protein n=1 Tax=Phenylobacterium sp. TaxID=1871053 RepID=UPI0025D612CD|nr:thiolase domain-containing protein [Phenylobacterium sp.]